MDDDTFEAPHLRCLTPTSGGQFHALETVGKGGCMIVDVMIPPYDNARRSGRFYLAKPLRTGTDLSNQEFQLVPVDSTEYHVRDV